MSLLDGMYVMVDHTPPPGNIMLAMVRGHRRLGLIEPEIRPWVYKGVFVLANASVLKMVCNCLATKRYCEADVQSEVSRLAAFLMQRYIFGNETMSSTYWLGQCSECLRVWWHADGDTAIRWQSRYATAVDAGHTEGVFNPTIVLSKKPARNPHNWASFKEFESGMMQRPFAPGRRVITPTFQL